LGPLAGQTPVWAVAHRSLSGQHPPHEDADHRPKRHRRARARVQRESQALCLGLFACPPGKRYAERRSTCRPRRHSVRPDTNRTTAIASGNRMLRPVKARAAGATFPYISTSLHSLPGHLLAADGSPQTHKPRALPQYVGHDELGEEQHRE